MMADAIKNAAGHRPMNSPHKQNRPDSENPRRFARNSDIFDPEKVKIKKYYNFGKFQKFIIKKSEYANSFWLSCASNSFRINKSQETSFFI